MKITKEQIKETLKLVMNEEADYKVFFKKALEKAGKSIPSMSDDEKKAFFNKIDAAWDAKSEVKEGNAFGAAVVAAKEAGEDEFEVDGEKFKVEESHSDCGCGCGGVTEGGCNTKSVNEGTDIYQLKKIQITKFAGKGEQMIQINAPKYQTAGDHLVMTKKEFMHVLKMAPLLLKQLKESVINEISGYDDKTGLYYIGGVPFSKERIMEVANALKKKPKSAVSQFDYTPVIRVFDKVGREEVDITPWTAQQMVKSIKKYNIASDKDIKNESVVNESVVKEAIDFAGWVAIDHKGKRLEIKKSEAKDLYNAKLLAIKKLKVPKSKESMLAIKPAYNESVNEASKEAMGIAALTGTRGSAVEDFILKHELDGKKLFKSITKANLRGRLNFVSALAGKDGNPNQKLTIKLHKENFNEELSTELAFEVITFMERPVMETVMVDEFEKSDIVEMLVNEGINDVLTEGVKAEFNTLVETYNKK